MTRTVHCDFCNARLIESGWECPARSFDYEGERVALDDPHGPAIAGSEGSWLACDECVELVRKEDRAALARAGVRANQAMLPRSYPIEAAVRDVTTLHDAFWRNRMGEPVPLTREQIAEIAEEADYTTEPRAS